MFTMSSFYDLFMILRFWEIKYTWVYMPQEGGFILSHAKEIGGIINYSFNELLYLSFLEWAAPAQIPVNWATLGFSSVCPSFWLSFPVPLPGMPAWA